MMHQAKSESRATSAWLLSLACTLMVSSIHAQTSLSQEEKLTAIRQGLVQAAMEGPTKVESTVWLDAKGSLQESSTFRTGMQVRGVRVLSYDRDNLGQPTADMRWQTVPKNEVAPTAAKATSACAVEREGRLQHVIGLTVTPGQDWRPDDMPVMRTMGNLLLNQFEHAGASAVVWKMSPGARVDRTAYEKALLGNSADDMPWRAHVTLLPVTKPAALLITDPANGVGVPTVFSPPPETRIQVYLALTGRNQRQPIFEARAQIKLRTEAQNWAPSRLAEETQDLFAEQVKQWSLEIQKRLSCEPVLPEVILTNTESIRINAGALAGVRVGDELMLANGQNYTKKILDKGVASQSVLAKVQAVGEHYAQLQLLAGPQQAVQRSWRAWPAEMSR